MRERGACRAHVDLKRGRDGDSAYLRARRLGGGDTRARLLLCFLRAAAGLRLGFFVEGAECHVLAVFILVVALIIVLAGLLPVIIINRSLSIKR